MPFRHISAKVQLKNLKQHFDWGVAGLPRPLLATPLSWALAVGGKVGRALPLDFHT